MKGKISLNNFIQENMNRNIIYSLIGMLIFVLTACTDDWLNNEGERMPEGEVSVSATKTSMIFVCCCMMRKEIW